MDTSRYGYLVISDDVTCIADAIQGVVEEVSSQLLSWGHKGFFVCGGYYKPASSWRAVVCVTHNGMSELDAERACTYVQTKFGIPIKRLLYIHDSEVFETAKIINHHFEWKQQSLIYGYEGERYDVVVNGVVNGLAAGAHSRAVASRVDTKNKKS